MSAINTTINIMTQDGTLIPLNEKIKETKPVLSQPSVIDVITQPTGDGYYTGYVMKKERRTQVDTTAATKAGGVGGFKGASSQIMHKIMLEKLYRSDNIIWNEVDLIKLKEGKNGDIVALEAGDFLITGRELDVKDLLASLKSKATAANIFTAIDANSAATGVQPTQVDNTFESGVTALQGGKRVITLDDGELDKKKTNRIDIIRTAVQYLNEIGTGRSAETEYLFSINGINTSNIKILARYIDRTKIKDDETMNLIRVTPQTQRNIVGLVMTIDNDIDVLQTNQLPSDTTYVVMSDRCLVRDLDPNTQYIGKVRDGLSVKMNDGSTVNLQPTERALQFMQGRVQEVVFETEAFFIDG